MILSGSSELGFNGLGNVINNYTNAMFLRGGELLSKYLMPKPNQSRMLPRICLYNSIS